MILVKFIYAVKYFIFWKILKAFMQSFFLQRNYFWLHKNQRNYLCSHFWKSFLNLTAYYAVKLFRIGSLRSPRGFAPFLLTTAEHAVSKTKSGKMAGLSFFL